MKKRLGTLLAALAMTAAAKAGAAADSPARCHYVTTCTPCTLFRACTPQRRVPPGGGTGTQAPGGGNRGTGTSNAPTGGRSNGHTPHRP